MYKKYINSFYLFVLALSIGAVFCAGALSAPVIFTASNYTIIDIDRFNSGLIMSEIFRRLNYLLNFNAFLILLFEGWNYLTFKRDKIILISSFITVCCTLLFTLYYTPFILESLLLGANKILTPQFEGMHKGSEIAFKLLFISLAVLFVKKVINYDKN
ncbi:MAG: DUF4149 domain-containing protein [Campylobacterales bacterium]|nr:DUF4149 domain-containing protein [Campylobacterales bacterium]